MTNLCINYSNDLWFISISRCCYFFVFLFLEFWLSEKAECDVTDKRGSKTLCGINLGTLWLPAFCQLLGTRGFWDGLNAINRKHTNLSETVFLSFWRVLVFNLFFYIFHKGKRHWNSYNRRLPQSLYKVSLNLKLIWFQFVLFVWIKSLNCDSVNVYQDLILNMNFQNVSVY